MVFNFSWLNTVTSWGGSPAHGLIYTAPKAASAPVVSYTAPVVAPQATPVTPVFDPKIAANALYGKPMALSALGFARIGASPAPIVGPYFNAGTVSFVVSFGVPADPDGTRLIYKIYLDNELAWVSITGGTVPADGSFTAEEFDFTFKQGRLDQTVCSLETTHFPGDENAYRPQMLLEIKDIPYARFMANTGKPVPYVACDIGDTTDGADPQDLLSVGEIVERVAYSPWAGYDISTFESVNITDGSHGGLFKDNFTIVDVCASITSLYKNLYLLQSDKLRLKDRGASVEPVFVFDLDSIIGGDNPIQIMRSSPSEQPRELELLAIDPDQDYTAVSSLSQRTRAPVTVSAAVGKQVKTLPLILDAETRQSLVTFAQYHEENARKRISFKVCIIGLEVEPGDLMP